MTSDYYSDFKQAAQPLPALHPVQPAEAAPAKAGQATALSTGAIAALIRGAVASVLGADVGADQPLVEAGLDSLGENVGLLWLRAWSLCSTSDLAHHSPNAGAVELRNEIGKAVGMELPGTLVFDYPSISAISGMLAAKLQPKQDIFVSALPARCASCLSELIIIMDCHLMGGVWYAGMRQSRLYHQWTAALAQS